MLEPIVRLIVACEDAGPRPDAPNKIDIRGVMTAIDAPADAFPFTLSFGVYICFTNTHGHGSGRIAIVHDVDDEVVFEGEVADFDVGNDPTALIATMMPVPACTFPYPDLYRIAFVYNEVAVVDYLLNVRLLS